MDIKLDSLVYHGAHLLKSARDYADEVSLNCVEGTPLESRQKKELIRHYESISEQALILVLNQEGLHLQMLRPSFYRIKVDFCDPQMRYRISKGGGRGQMIARALGVKNNLNPNVLDATAGLGKDAFVLASLGCSVTMLERNPVIHLLLHDGIKRAQSSAANDELLKQTIDRLTLLKSEALEYFGQVDLGSMDAIFLDPMFPEPEKRAQVKKEMQMLQNLLGDQLDASDLLTAACSTEVARVVVKRPRIAPSLSDEAPDTVMEGKSNRYDIYFNLG